MMIRFFMLLLLTGPITVRRLRYVVDPYDSAVMILIHTCSRSANL